MQSFSKQTAWPRKPTHLSAVCGARMQSGQSVVDLTCANPTSQGFVYEPDVLATFWPRGQFYCPASLGLPEARKAVAGYVCERGGHIGPEGVWIGSGTSELYAFTMSILCDPGACWLVPQPGYPLFDYVADLAGVQLAHYPLVWDDGWYLDGDSLEAAAVASGARALVVISPHNPTGHVLSLAEREMVVQCCARHDMALIVDEVFLDFPVDMTQSPASCGGCEEVLTICLSGASKVAAFPQGKIAWAAVSGPGADEFLARAELVSDTFLSTSTVIQSGLPALLAASESMRERIRARCRANLARARQLLVGSAVSVCPVQAGWSMLLRFPRTYDDARWSLRALEEYGVLTHPGYLFGMESVSKSPFLGVSLLLDTADFQAGIESLVCLVGDVG